ncbi:hypothetical protein K439DRAFT_1630974 [Ramaria rubella]|nr:hypothetical protein K439DRAFT_1630974 [Ramaria rubella]
MTTPTTHDIPRHHKGQVVLSATIYPSPGRADETQKLLSALRKSAIETEKGCLEYRATRSFTPDGLVKIQLFEVYKTVDDLDVHFSTKAFHDWDNAAKNTGLLTKPRFVEYYYEFF